MAAADGAVAGDVRAGNHFRVQMYIVKRTGGGETVFHLEPSGRPVTQLQARALIASGEFKPTGDSLFADADLSQTWTLREGAHP
jgi:hypothetical protein